MSLQCDRPALGAFSFSSPLRLGPAGSSDPSDISLLLRGRPPSSGFNVRPRLAVPLASDRAVTASDQQSQPLTLLVLPAVPALGISLASALPRFARPPAHNNSFKPNPPRYAFNPDASALLSASD